VKLIAFLLLNLVLVWSSPILSNDVLKQFPELHNAGVVIIDTQAKALISANENTAYIPASTTKLVTAWLALSHWGEDHHFRTHFYFDELTKTLWIKGSGDPFLVSEELLLIAQNLTQFGLSEVQSIGIDNSLFQVNLLAPGASKTNNPYDAIPTSLAANFNTVDVKKVAGKIVSAEVQTPLTATAKKIAMQQHINTHSLRINTGFSSRNSEQYFAELLATFLRQQGVSVTEKIIWSSAPKLTPYYTHINSKSLAEIIRPMMKYSTNFIANQLVLILSADFFQRPANFNDVQQYMEMTMHKQFGWQNIVLQEGAGLSRENRLSPKQLVELLNKFRPWQHLLPKVTTNIYAKSGTLNGVSTLAGYAMDDNQNWNAFSLMMTQSVRHKRRNVIAEEIAEAASATNRP